MRRVLEDKEKGAQYTGVRIMFKSAEHALDWAYNTAARPIVKMAAINNMRQGTKFGGQNLNPQDAHGQAAQIIGLVEKLSDPAGREYLGARFGRMIERKDLTHVVYTGCFSLGFGLEKQEPVYRIVKSYFHGEMSLRSIARTLECRFQYAVMAKHCIYDVLNVINDHSIAEISEELERRELIKLSRYA